VDISRQIIARSGAFAQWMLLLDDGRFYGKP
jgi:hypothetical protein